ncbi:MAG TPA: antibiotic biosynthesis monooxygenase [Nitriliruptorales bacterium]
MVTVIARLPVADFDTWHAEYERMHPVREQQGERGRRLYRDLDDPNTIVVVFDWDTVESARGYFGSDELRASVERAHGCAPPTVHYLTEHGGD